MNSSSYLPRLRMTVLLGLMSAMTGCYLVDSARGQFALMSKREPIASVIDRPGTPPGLRMQLQRVRSIRDFASRELGLPDNGSYRSYADVGRRYVVWNVVAAPEFSVEPEQWCFPIVGCVAYRGYFAESQAQDYAARLRRRHFDVTVGGVAAYSTLGHFDDPILNTMIGWDDVELAGIVFHELTHQLLYVSGDASFNEALATTVEEEGIRRWLILQRRMADLERHQVQQAQFIEVIGRLRRTRRTLDDLYRSGVDVPSMRERKRAIFGTLQASYKEMRAQWQDPGPFDAWFAGGLNNAHLASIATYYDCVAGFQRELTSVQGDLGRFYARVKQLASLTQAARDAAVCESTEFDGI